MNNEFKIDFIGIGAEKAGSTWIADILSSHPGVCLSEPKEINYFNKYKSYVFPPINPNFEKGLSWYRKYFLHCKKENKLGEFTTIYLSDPYAPGKIKETFPDVKIIVTLRNPVERAYSQYMMYRYYMSKEKRDFETVISREPEYIDKGLYYKNLSRFMNYFNREQIKIVLLDDIRKSPERIASEIYDFIGVDRQFCPPNIFGKSNPAMKIKIPVIWDLMRSFTKSLVALRMSFILVWLKKIGMKKHIMWLNTSSYEYVPMSHDAKIFLYNAFYDDIKSLETMLGRDLSSWLSIKP